MLSRQLLYMGHLVSKTMSPGQKKNNNLVNTQNLVTTFAIQLPCNTVRKFIRMMSMLILYMSHPGSKLGQHLMNTVEATISTLFFVVNLLT